MRTFDTIPERSDFGYQCLVGPQKVSGPKLADLRDHFGLKLTKHMPFGSVRDEEGHIYSMVRALNAPGSTPNPTKFIYQSTRLDGQNIRIDKEKIAPRALTLFPAHGLDGDTAWWASHPEDPGQPWRLTASGTGFSWREEGLLDLTGQLIGNGMQWYLPGVDWGTFYVAQLYDVQGTCEGRKVKGMISLDQAWMAEGGAIHMHKDLVVNNKMHVIWWNFATIYKDGSWDVGSFLVGHDKLGYAIVQNERARSAAPPTSRAPYAMKRTDGLPRMPASCWKARKSGNSCPIRKAGCSTSWVVFPSPPSRKDAGAGWVTCASPTAGWPGAKATSAMARRATSVAPKSELENPTWKKPPSSTSCTPRCGHGTPATRKTSSLPTAR